MPTWAALALEPPIMHGSKFAAQNTPPVMQPIVCLKEASGQLSVHNFLKLGHLASSDIVQDCADLVDPLDPVYDFLFSCGHFRTSI